MINFLRQIAFADQSIHYSELEQGRRSPGLQINTTVGVRKNTQQKVKKKQCLEFYESYKEANLNTKQINPACCNCKSLLKASFY